MVLTAGWSARQGLITAAGVVLALLVALRLGLDDPWWAALSAWVVANQDRHSLWSKAAQRALGTALGLGLGLVLAAATAGIPTLLLLALFAVGAAGARGRFASAHGYAWLYAGVTATMVLMQAASTPVGLLAFAQWRMIEITVGVLAATLIGTMFAVEPAAHPAGTPHPPSALGRLTLAGGMLPVLVLLVWQALDLPAVVQMAATSMVLLDRDVGSVQVRARQRLFGCLLGGVCGLAVVLGLDLATLPLWLATIGGGLFLFSILHQGGGPSAYVGTQAGVAWVMTMVSGRGPPALLLPVLDRLMGITLGVCLILVVAALVAPARPACEPAT
ncbi:MAG: hypothetical protein JWR10_4361 [Rubritepida sp.]|nr:hypothetical protein [Rubritepida sp.]